MIAKHLENYKKWKESSANDYELDRTIADIIDDDIVLVMDLMLARDGN